MPTRETNNGRPIKTLKDLREFVKSLDDLDDEYEVDFNTNNLGECVEVESNCDVSYSNKCLSIGVNVRQY